ncbi:MAG: ferrous iron transporter B [Lysobacteraceae bacterium]|nr:MAG: ferrous iron transporter B [Xanthomonadaceae bacterium]
MSAVASTPLVALLGNPNCGKTALFNLLTGARQKVANYAGVTVERKEGQILTPSGRRLRILDLPGAYSLNPESEDEAVTRAVLLGEQAGEAVPDLLVCVADACNLRLNLRLVLELKRLGRPMLLALNMTDVAERRGIRIDRERLAQALGMPVVDTVGIRRHGADALLAALDAAWPEPSRAGDCQPPSREEVLATHREVRRILAEAVQQPARDEGLDERIDRIVMHPVLGLVLLAGVLFLMFQAVFAWAEVPMALIEGATAALAEAVGGLLDAGPLRSLLLDGIIAGVGGVLVFLPQILILFAFILALEDSGYLPRAAFLLDRFMGKVGLSGRSFIPLLSSFACAVPGIMATRVISHPRDRLVTILIAPLMTCSARLPVYALLIAAFIPDRAVGVFNLQGIVLFVLYLAGILGAMLVAWVMRLGEGRGARHPLLMELPAWRLPSLRNLSIGLYERAAIFLRRVGGIILSLTVLIWALSSYPAPPPGAEGPPILHSFAGMLGRAIEPLFAPLGFGWQICVALVPGMAAREVAVGALATVYALSGSEEEVGASLATAIASDWSLATAAALLAWYVFAPQCISTLAVMRRETLGWKVPLAAAAYLFAMAWLAAFATYQVAVAMGLG